MYITETIEFDACKIQRLKQASIKCYILKQQFTNNHRYVMYISFCYICQDLIPWKFLRSLSKDFKDKIGPFIREKISRLLIKSRVIQDANTVV